MMNDTDYLSIAIAEAQKGVADKAGGPFGAVIADTQGVIAAGHNTVLQDHDPTAHAEMNAIRKAARVKKSGDLAGLTLVTTSEPCPMCLCASYWANISRIVVGAPSSLAAEYGFRDDHFYAALAQLPPQRRDALIFLEQESAIRLLFDTWQQQNGTIY